MGLALLPLLSAKGYLVLFLATNTAGAGRDLWLLRLVGLVSAEARTAAGMMHPFAWDVTMGGAALQRAAGFAPQVEYEEEIARGNRKHR